MKRTLLVLGTMAFCGVAYAQVPPANPDPRTPAPATEPQTRGTVFPGNVKPAVPADVANSLNEAQAKARLEAAGFSNVTGLTKGKDGVWHGKATKNGSSHNVTLDYQGHVLPR